MLKTKKRTHKMQPRTKLIMICVVVFVIAMLISWFRLHQKTVSLAKEEARIEKQIKEAKEQKKELNEKKEYVKTKEFIEKLATEKFGLLHSDEYLLKAQE